MAKSDEEFLGLLRKSRDVAYVVADSLEQRGHRVRIVPNTVRADFEERWKHTDNGDLEITQRVEVKHWPRIDFKSRDEVPYENVIVDEAYKVEKRHDVPLYAYLIVNASMTGYLVVPMWTRPHWFRRHCHDRRDNTEREFFMCPRIHTHYMTMRAVQ